MTTDSRIEHERARDEAAKKSYKWLALGVALLAAMGIAVWKPWVKYGDDFCLLDGDKHRTLILFDETDPLTENHRRRIDRWFREEFERKMRKYERIILHMVDAEEAEAAYSEPEFDRCYPIKGEFGMLDYLIVKPAARKKYADKNFWVVLADTLEKMEKVTEQSASPILEMLSNGLEKDALFMKSGDAGMPRQRIVIISDMLLHMPEYSHYNHSQDFSAFQAAKTTKSESYSAQFLPPELDLQNIEVVILYVRRPQAQGLQRVEHKQFWIDYFSQFGKRPEVVPISDKPCRPYECPDPDPKSARKN